MKSTSVLGIMSQADANSHTFTSDNPGLRKSRISQVVVKKTSDLSGYYGDSTSYITGLMVLIRPTLDLQLITEPVPHTRNPCHLIER